MTIVKNVIFVAIVLCCIWKVFGQCNGTRCSNDMPCCASKDQTTLCCPYVGGTCCDDGLHCCPKDTACRSSKGVCLPSTRYGIPDIWRAVSYVPLHPQVGPRQPQVRPELCPSKRAVCPSKSTCCPLPYIGYDCCPLSRGVCCSDFLSCCPADHSCDLTRGECVSPQGERMPTHRKSMSFRLHSNATTTSHRSKVIVIFKHDQHHPSSVVTCRDTNSVTPITCDSHQKCCPAGCCPTARGVCCGDGATCCPTGTTCDTERRTCNGTSGTAPAVELIKGPRQSPPSTPVGPEVAQRIAVLPLPSNVTLCPGGQYTCPTRMTCCPTATEGKFGCCPFPNATCCSDKWHCCPQGATCNLAKDRCDRGGIFMPMFQKYDAEAVQSEMKTMATPTTIATTTTNALTANMSCPDQSTCPDTYTCCKMPNDKYGCCPMTAAVCCSDQIHCCPHGTICDLAAGGCRQGGEVKLLPLTNRKTATENNPPPPKSRAFRFECSGDLCKDGSCCKVGWRSFGCCAHKEAVCCGDGKHCCPLGSWCELKKGLCVSKSQISPVFSFYSYV